MLKKIRDIEKKFYELIGIKRFRKMAFGFRKVLCFPILIFFPKEMRKRFFENPSNYCMKRGNGIQDLKDFKLMLLFNTLIHIWGLWVGIPLVKDLALGIYTALQGLLIVPPFVVNIYCIFLQRYNHIRINEVIEKYEKYEELKEKREKLNREKEAKEKYDDLLQYIEMFSKNVENLNKSKQEEGLKVVGSKKFNIPEIPVNKPKVLSKKVA